VEVVNQGHNLTEQSIVEDVQQGPKTFAESDSDQEILMEKPSEENMREPLTLAQLAPDLNTVNPQGIRGILN